MATYTVAKTFRADNGQNLKTGQVIEMAPRQAKYLVLAGKLSLKSAKAGKAKARPAKTRKE